MAIQLLASRYQMDLDTGDFIKATYLMTDPKNAEIFLALKDMKDNQEI